MMQKTFAAVIFAAVVSATPVSAETKQRIPAALQGTWYIVQVIGPQVRSQSGIVGTEFQELVGKPVTIRADRLTRPWNERTSYEPIIEIISAPFSDLVGVTPPGTSFAPPNHDDPVTAIRITFASCDNKRQDPKYNCDPVLIVPTETDYTIEMILPSGYAVLGRKKSRR